MTQPGSDFDVVGVGAGMAGLRCAAEHCAVTLVLTISGAPVGRDHGHWA